jgi:hypothetical protein
MKNVVKPTLIYNGNETHTLKSMQINETLIGVGNQHWLEGVTCHLQELFLTLIVLTKFRCYVETG